MKLRVTVEGRIYEVEVEHVDPALPLTARPAAPVVATSPANIPLPPPRVPQASRPGNGPVPAAPKPESKPEAKPEAKPAPAVAAPVAARPAAAPSRATAPVAPTTPTFSPASFTPAPRVTTPPPLPPAEPGPHDISVHLAGVIHDVHVKVGDAVRVGDALLDFEASTSNHGPRPFAGTVHTRYAGVVKDIMVKSGDKAAANQPLLRIGE